MISTIKMMIILTPAAGQTEELPCEESPTGGTHLIIIIIIIIILMSPLRNSTLVSPATNSMLVHNNQYQHQHQHQHSSSLTL